MARDNDNGLNSGMLGLIFGFVAGAAAVILSDPDKREKVVQTATNLASNAKGTIADVAEQIKENSQKINETVQSKVSQIEKAVDKEIEKTENQEV